MRRALSLCRAGMGGTAALVVLVACGGGGTAADAPSAGSSATETSAASGQDGFCAQAAGIDERVDAAMSELEGDDPSVPDAFHRLAEELRAVDPPAEIAGDWQTQAEGLDRIADALSDIDLTDPGSFASLDEIDRELSTASTNVDAYLRDECGL